MAKNLIIKGGIYHPFDETSEALADLLAPLGIESEITLDIEGALADLSGYDLVTMNCLRWRMIQHEKYIPFRDEWAMELSETARQSLKNHVQGGGGLLGLHTASICFDTWPEWRDLLGAMWQWGKSHHPEIGDINVSVDPDAHVLVNGLEDFELFDEIYHHLDAAPGAVPMLSAEAEEGPQPLLFAHEAGQGRSVYSSLGHDAVSMRHPTHSRLLQRAACWALGGSDDEVRAL